MTPRLRELRRAARAVWWQVIRRPATADLSRRAWLRIAWGHVWCGALTGGEHWWGPLRYEHEGARLRKRHCRLCRAKLTPASEFAENPLTAEEQADIRKYIRTQPLTDADVQAALDSAAMSGIYRKGKFIWD